MYVYNMSKGILLLSNSNFTRYFFFPRSLKFIQTPGDDVQWDTEVRPLAIDRRHEKKVEGGGKR